MGTVVLDTSKTVATEMEIFTYMNYVSIFVATVLELPFSVLMYKSLVFGDEFLAQGLHLK